MSKSVVIKYNQVVCKDDDRRVIDTNEQIAERLRQLQNMMNKSEPEEIIGGFTEGLNAEQVDYLLTEEETPVYTGPSPEELVQNAMEEAEKIRQDAAAEIELMRRNAMEEGRQAGYLEGYGQGSAQAQQEAAEQEKQFRQKAAEQQQQWETAMEQMEPLLIETLTGIYEQIFHVSLSNFREIIVHLITETLHKVEGNRDFIIHLSKEDYPFVTMNKQQIMANLTANSTVEFIEDALLAKNACLIETGGGIFDCGVDTQLEELGKQLKLLSYEK